MRDELFIPRLKAKISETRTSLCVGIDPHVAGLPPFFQSELRRLGPQAFLEQWASVLIEAAAGRVPAVKPQSAFFEAFGAPGFAALESTVALAKRKGLITVLDAKRGDISSTMAAYGRMAFDVMKADALTVTSYIGLDSIDPLVPWLRQGHGVYVVWVSSNPGGALLQNAVYEQLFEALATHFEKNEVSTALGLVLGATKVDQIAAALAEKLRRVSLLLPGVGAQGGQVTPKLKGLLAEGISLVPQSRSLAEPETDDGSWQIYGSKVAERIARAAAELAL
jgi:orotidine 5'-phosphate decarboxylase subfamily 2